jgi:hypothetical protein
MNPVYIIAIVLMLLAACLPIMCLVKMKMNKRFRKKAIKTTAEIFHVEKRNGYRSIYYIIQLRYKAIDTGVEYRGQTVFGNKNKVKEIIPVWYKADDPAVFKTDDGKWMRWALIFSLIFFALTGWLSVWLLSMEYTYRPD